MSTSARSEAEYTALLRATGLDDFAGRLYKIDEETAVRVETSMGAARMRISCIVSATIGNATFRAPPACRRWDVAEIAQAALLRVLGDGNAARSSDVALLASEPISALGRRRAWCSKGVEGEIHEFLHAHIPLSPELARTVVEFPDTDLAVAISICKRVHNEWADIPRAVLVLPAICSYRYAERHEGSALQIRVNVYGVFSEIHRIFKEQGFDSPPGIRMFVIRPLGFGEAPSDPESDAIWLEGNDSLVRRFRLELVPA